jgi:ribosome maturation factor RimP
VRAVVEVETVRDAVEPVVARLGLELVDIEVVGAGRGRTLRVTVDRDGGIDLDGITAATQAVSPVIDDIAVLDGTFTLEVSSPGVERPLRRPEEFRRFVGTTITLKTHEPVEGTRRLRGPLTAADDEGIEIDVDGTSHRLVYEAVAQARTVFEWGPAPKPGGPKPVGKATGRPKEKRRR